MTATLKADACDELCHFATVVPRRALCIPMILYAILALASRYEAFLQGVRDLGASYYQGQYLKLLIEALSKPEDSYDENLLTAVILLRLYEGLHTQEDDEFHLAGTTRLLNAVEKFSSSGGLGEAPSWQSLRQAVHISLVRKQPLDVNLENYRHSAVFHKRTDADCANVMVFILAKTLRLATPATHHMDAGLGSISSVEEEVYNWHRTRPSSFQPIHYEAPDLVQYRPFPEIWMMAPAQGICAVSYKRDYSYPKPN